MHAQINSDHLRMKFTLQFSMLDARLDAEKLDKQSLTTRKSPFAPRS